MPVLNEVQKAVIARVKVKQRTNAGANLLAAKAKISSYLTSGGEQREASLKKFFPGTKLDVVRSDRSVTAILTKLKKHIADSPVTVNVPISLFQNHVLLRSGSLKTVWELPNQDQPYLDKRNAVEKQGLGYTDDPTQTWFNRPFYGAVNFGKYAGGAAPRYGCAFFVFKEAVKTRSTYSATDSYNFSELDPNITYDSGQKRFTGTSVNKMLDHFCTVDNLDVVIADLDEQQMLILMTAAYTPTGIDAIWKMNSPPKYIEMQVQGGVDFANDIEAVHVYREDAVENATKGYTHISGEDANLNEAFSLFGNFYGVPIKLCSRKGIYPGNPSTDIFTVGQKIRTLSSGIFDYKTWKTKRSLGAFHTRSTEIMRIDAYVQIYKDLDTFRKRLTWCNKLESEIDQFLQKKPTTKRKAALEDLKWALSLERTRLTAAMM